MLSESLKHLQKTTDFSNEGGDSVNYEEGNSVNTQARKRINIECHTNNVTVVLITCDGQQSGDSRSSAIRGVW
jgi:hypothetical protein